MRIDSNGQLLVGTTQSSAYGNRQLAVGDVSQTGTFIEIRTGGTGTGHLLFSQTAGANSGNYQGYIAYDHNTDHMSFHTGGGNQRARIDSHGLKFGSDSAAANALDDYEEGTWTPTFGGQLNSQSYSQQVGQYTKIGNFVIATCQLKLAGDPGSYASNVHIDGLPFAGKTGGIGGAAVFAYQTNFISATDGRDNFTGMVNPTQSTIRFYTPDGTYLLWSEVNDRDEQIRVTATYRTN